MYCSSSVRSVVLAVISLRTPALHSRECIIDHPDCRSGQPPIRVHTLPDRFGYRAPRVPALSCWPLVGLDHRLFSLWSPGYASPSPGGSNHGCGPLRDSPFRDLLSGSICVFPHFVSLVASRKSSVSVVRVTTLNRFHNWSCCWRESRRLSPAMTYPR